jgi:uncharacterized protein YkwD/uncharacterized membrane protein required for colicin V production
VPEIGTTPTNWVDVGIFLIIAWNIANGIRRGFFGSLIDLAEFTLSLVVALTAYVQVGDWAADQWGVPPLITRPLAFGVLWLVTSVVVGLLGRLITAPVAGLLKGHAADLLLSLVPSTLKGLAVAAFVVTMLLAVPELPPGLPGGPALANLHEALQASAFAGDLAERASAFDRFAREVVGDPLNQTLTVMTVKPESGERVDLGFKVASPQSDLASEEKLFQLLNQERAKAGLAPVVRDPTLDAVARSYSVEMLQEGYFAHDAPDGRSPFDRMRDGGVRFLTAGENLAFAPTVELAHQALMDSPGHRANILRPEFGRVGIGVAQALGRGRMFTEDFAN